MNAPLKTTTIGIEELHELREAKVQLDIIEKVRFYDQTLAEHAKNLDAWSTRNSCDLNEILDEKRAGLEKQLDDLDFEIKQLVVKYAALDLNTEVREASEAPVEYLENNEHYYLDYDCGFTGDYDFDVELIVFGKEE